MDLAIDKRKTESWDYTCIVLLSWEGNKFLFLFSDLKAWKRKLCYQKYQGLMKCVKKQLYLEFSNFSKIK